MVSKLSFGFVVLTAFVLGLRHGLDWDHLAAISDIVGASESRKEGFLLGTIYAFGHALVIIFFGLLAIILGARLPKNVDNFMEPVVGVTLILLSVYLMVSLVHHFRSGGEFRLRSRWTLVFQLLRHLHQMFHHFLKHPLKPKETRKFNYSLPVALGVGMIHGLGAETPSQVLVLAAAAGAAGGAVALLILLAFVSGLFISNSLLVILTNFGFTRFAKNQNLLFGLSLVTAIFSFTIGLMFLTHHGTFLPAIFGG